MTAPCHRPAANPERVRLGDCALENVPCRKWGPYLSERQWATVREDYGDNGAAWDYFPHDQARSRVNIECPAGSGHMMNLFEVATEISRRLAGIFLRDASGKCPVFGDVDEFRTIHTGGTTSTATDISTETTVKALAPATRPAGPASPLASSRRWTWTRSRLCNPARAWPRSKKQPSNIVGL